MSFQAMTWAVSQRCGSPSAKLVLLMLADHANGHTCQCNPRHKLLAEECDMTVETLKSNIKKLEALGLIKVISQFAEGVQLPNQYILNVPPGGGKNSGEGGGKNSGEGGGKNSPPYNQEVNQEVNQREAPHKRGATPQRPEGVEDQVWEDWLALRKAKKAPVTATVIAGAEREARKAGMSLNAFLSAWCQRGSQGLEAAWLKPDGRSNGHRYAVDDKFAGVI